LTKFTSVRRTEKFLLAISTSSSTKMASGLRQRECK
jgi:hypothetical protein